MIPFSVVSVSEKREAYSAEKGSDRTRNGGFCVYETIWIDPADRVHIDTWKDGIAKWFASTGWQTHKHVIPFQKKLLTARSWSGLTWLYPSLATAKETNASCKSAMLPVNHVTSPCIMRSLQSDWICWDFGREHDFLWRVTRPSLPIFFRRAPHPQLSFRGRSGLWDYNHKWTMSNKQTHVQILTLLTSNEVNKNFFCLHPRCGE